MQPNETPLDTLAISDLEDQIDSLLRSHGQSDLWQLAADLARRGIKPEVLESLFATLDADVARAALVRIAASVGDCEPVDRNREQHVANLRPGARGQGIHLHGPDPGAKRGHRKGPGEHAYHPESQAQAGQ